MMRRALLILALTFCTATASADTTKKGVFCMTEEHFEQFVAASVENDQAALNWLTANACGALKPGLSVTVLSRAFIGPWHVRLYLEGGAVEVWVNGEAIDVSN